MRVIICGSISAAEEILAAQRELEALGHEVEVPLSVKDAALRRKDAELRERGAREGERADVKIEHDLIRGHYEKMKRADAVLVVNPERKGIPGYIGGNTFIEMAFAHVLRKPLSCLHALPEMAYSSELIAMRPRILDGDVRNLVAGGRRQPSPALSGAARSGTRRGASASARRATSRRRRAPARRAAR